MESGAAFSQCFWKMYSHGVKNMDSEGNENKEMSLDHI